MLHRRKDNAESREFWAFVTEASKEAQKLPEWKQNELHSSSEYRGSSNSRSERTAAKAVNSSGGGKIIE